MEITYFISQISSNLTMFYWEEIFLAVAFLFFLFEASLSRIDTNYEEEEKLETFPL